MDGHVSPLSPADLKPSWWQQYRALLTQKALLARRSWISTSLQVSMGLWACLLLLGFQFVANAVLSHSVPHPPAALVGAPPKCNPMPHSVAVGPAGSTVVGACNTILFAPTSPAINRVMSRLAADAGLLYGTDVAPFPGASAGPDFDLQLVNATASNSTVCVVGSCSIIPSAECLPCAIVRDNATMTDWLLRNPNSTQNSVWFPLAYLSGDLSAAISYNYSATIYPLFEDSHSMSVKQALDKVVLELAAEDRSPNGTTASFDARIWQRQFPQPTPRVNGYDGACR